MSTTLPPRPTLLTPSSATQLTLSGHQEAARKLVIDPHGKSTA